MERGRVCCSAPVLSDAEIFGVLFVGLPPGLGECVVDIAVIGLEFAVVVSYTAFLVFLVRV